MSVATTGVCVRGLTRPSTRSTAAGQDRSRAEAKISRPIWIWIATTALKIATAMPTLTRTLRTSPPRSTRK